MNYYLGHVVIEDRASNREYGKNCVIAAPNEVKAQHLLRDWAGDWDSDPQANARGGYVYSSGDDPYVVTPGDVSVISPNTFRELAKRMPSFGEPLLDLDGQTLPEATKTLARQLQGQLAKDGVRIQLAKRPLS